jgi:hypothetical protein
MPSNAQHRDLLWVSYRHRCHTPTRAATQAPGWQASCSRDCSDTAEVSVHRPQTLHHSQGCNCTGTAGVLSRLWAALCSSGVHRDRRCCAGGSDPSEHGVISWHSTWSGMAIRTGTPGVLTRQRVRECPTRNNRASLHRYPPVQGWWRSAAGTQTEAPFANLEEAALSSSPL